MRGEEYYKSLIETGEGERVEFKASYDKEAVLKSAGAMANKDGGIIFIGVTDEKKIKGWKAEQALKRISDDLGSAIEPALNISIKELSINNKNIVVIEIPPAPIKPVSVRGRYYIRIGSTNRLMSTSEICDLYSISTSRSWDTQIVEDARLEDLDLDRAERYMKMLGTARGIRPVEGPIQFLKKKLFIKDNRITNAAVLLFGSNPQMFFPSRVVQIIFYKENKYNVIFQEQIDGTVFDMIDESYEEVLKIISTKLEITGTVSVQRHSVPEEALREGIINAIAHRDWSVPSPIYIEISPKGVVISNPGALPPPLTPELLREADHYSILRNPKLSEALYETGYIERYGSGTVRIMALYESSNLKPNWWIKVGRTYLHLPLIRTSIEDAIINLAKRRQRITSTDIVRELGVSVNTARMYLKSLVKKGILIASGKTKGRYYTLASK